MKKRVLSLFALAAAFALTACQGNAESDYSQPLDSPGVASYELSGEAAYVVNAYGLSTNSWIYRFRSPEGAKGFNVNAYTLSETGEWVETGIGGLFFDEPQPEGGFSGVFTLVREKDGSLTLHILSDGASYDVSTEPVELGSYVASSIRTADYAPAELGEAVTVWFGCYTSGDALDDYQFEDLYKPEKLKEMDFAQYVSVEFTSESEA